MRGRKPHYPVFLRRSARSQRERDHLPVGTGETALPELPTDIQLWHADIQQAPFADNSFDTAVATTVFCSVADPDAGLGEVARVIKPGGSVLLLEHVRPRNVLLGRLFDLVNPITRRLFGFNINRPTEDNLAAAGLDIEQITREDV